MGGHHGGPPEEGDTLDHGLPASDRNVCSHPYELGDVHKAILEDRLGDAVSAVGDRHERCDLRLHIAGLAGTRTSAIPPPTLTSSNRTKNSSRLDSHGC